LLDAIAALAGAKPPSDAPASQSKSAVPKGHEVSAERRPITVMFCDLVGSTGLAAKLDPEDWRNLVNAYLDEASAAVTGLGGHLLKKLGDGLMALFGYPQAQENDAERAVRAALAIQRALADINARNAAACPVQRLGATGVLQLLRLCEVAVAPSGDRARQAVRITVRTRAGDPFSKGAAVCSRRSSVRWKGYRRVIEPGPRLGRSVDLLLPSKG
jgi:hypothetical protein